jgi:CRISPR-associated exonuclease Cas4
MFDVHIPQGAIYHASSKRRRSVEFGRQLRDRTEASIKRLHEMLAYGETPPPVLKPRCRGCSVRDVCMPEVFVNREQITRLSRSMYTPSNEPYAFE